MNRKTRWVARLLAAAIMMTGLDSAGRAEATPEPSAQTICLCNGHMMAVKADGSLWARGFNSYGQLGDGTTEAHSDWIRVMDNVTAVDTGYYHTAALQADGSFWMWGYLYWGNDLMGGRHFNSLTPVKVMESVTAFRMEDGNVLARTADGAIWCWGPRARGIHMEKYPADVSSIEPVALKDGVWTSYLNGILYSWDTAFKPEGSVWADGNERLSRVAEVRCGAYYALALQTDGSLWAWGSNTLGQLGDGSYKDRAEPVKILENVVGFSAGSVNASAVTDDGALWIWGLLDENDGEIYTENTPQKVLNGVVTAAAGHGETVAVRVDGTLWAREERPGWQALDAFVSLLDGVMLPGGAPYRTAPLFGLSSWAQKEADALNARGVVPSALKTRLQTPIRRDEFAALLVNVAEAVRGPIALVPSLFEDIGDSPYNEEIEKAKTLGLADGTSPKRFTPAGLLTREQAAKLLCTLASLLEGTETSGNGAPDFIDRDRISPWARPFVARCQVENILQGANGRFDPLGQLTREMALITAERLVVQYGWSVANPE